MGRWFLVRHGETDWNVEGRAQGQMHVPLNDRGLVQAEAIAARLRPMRFTAVYASDLRRVTQTAELIMRGRDVPLVTLPALRERGFGEWEGLTFTEMEARFPERYAALFSGDDTSAAPGGESERQLYERVAAGVDRLLEAHSGDDGNLLMVAHGGSLCATIVRLLALPSGSMERFSSGNCGLSIVTVYEGGFAALDLMNDRNHLGVRAVSGELVLLLGGARSGKSAAAERLAQAGRRVLFIATAEALDEDMRRRIAAHRERRPSGWDTLEEPLDPAGRAGPIVSRYDTVVLDCLTLWVSNLLLRHEDDPGAEELILDAAGGLLDLIERSTATWILISNEVGLGVVPPSPLGRAYRDALGRVNQLAAARAGRVYLMVAGLALELKELNAQPLTQLGM